MLQSEFISIFCQRPAQYAWFLGAGTSRTAGLPTAGDVIWDLKRRYYRLEQDRDVSPQDIQNEAVRARIQAFLDSQGFPPLWADEEYTTYFEKIFGEDRERQRKLPEGYSVRGESHAFGGKPRPWWVDGRGIDQGCLHDQF